METNQVELKRETLFKDSVLSAAEARRVQIIADAQRASARELEQAQAACELADHDLIAKQMQQDTAKEHAAAMQDARRELLLYRGRLVDELFAEVEQHLADFSQSKGYAAWLSGRAKQHAAAAKKQGAPIVFLRVADMPCAKSIQKALPGADVRQDDTIRLGGLKLACGRRLYDETLDAALLAEKERFTQNSALAIQDRDGT